jgi:hypothetical protein
MLLAINFDEHFVDVESVAIASVFSLQAAGINGAKLDAPQTNCFTASCDPSFSEKDFDKWSGTPAMAEIESLVLPDCVRNDIWRESVVLVSIHAPIL